MQRCKRDLQVVGELVHENQFALEDRRFHRPGGNPVPVRDGGLQWGNDQEGQGKRTEQVAPDFVGKVFHDETLHASHQGHKGHKGRRKTTPNGKRGTPNVECREETTILLFIEYRNPVVRRCERSSDTTEGLSSHCRINGFGEGEMVAVGVG
jgi:hypothetical protein